MIIIINSHTYAHGTGNILQDAGGFGLYPYPDFKHACSPCGQPSHLLLFVTGACPIGTFFLDLKLNRFIVIGLVLTSDPYAARISFLHGLHITNKQRLPRKRNTRTRIICTRTRIICNGFPAGVHRRMNTGLDRSAFVSCRSNGCGGSSAWRNNGNGVNPFICTMGTIGCAAV